MFHTYQLNFIVLFEMEIKLNEAMKHAFKSYSFKIKVFIRVKRNSGFFYHYVFNKNTTI